MRSHKLIQLVGGATLLAGMTAGLASTASTAHATSPRLRMCCPLSVLCMDFLRHLLHECCGRHEPGLRRYAERLGADHALRALPRIQVPHSLVTARLGTSRPVTRIRVKPGLYRNRAVTAHSGSVNGRQAVRQSLTCANDFAGHPGSDSWDYRMEIGRRARSLFAKIEPWQKAQRRTTDRRPVTNPRKSPLGQLQVLSAGLPR